MLHIFDISPFPQPLAFFFFNFTFSKMAYTWNHVACSFFILSSSTYIYAFIPLPHVFSQGLMVHLFLVLDNTPLSKVIEFVYPFTCQ